MRKCTALISTLRESTSRRAVQPCLANAISIRARRLAEVATNRKRIAVLGGGITGLATAYYIRKLAPQYGVTLFEASDHLGGWLKSTRILLPDGSVVFEAGPRSLRPVKNGILTARMAIELGLEHEMIITPRTAPAAKYRFLYYPDRIVTMPHPAQGLWKTLFKVWQEPIFKGVWSALLSDVQKPKRGDDVTDESISDFMRRRFGPGGAALCDNLLSGVMHGIYAGDVEKLSAQSLLPGLWVGEGQYGAVLQSIANGIQRGPLMSARDADFMVQMSRQLLPYTATARQIETCSVFTFKDGMGTLSDALARHLWEDDQVEILTSTAVKKVATEDDTTSLTMADGTDRTFDQIVSTLSVPHLASILPSVEHGLPHIPSTNVMTVNLLYKDAQNLPPGPSSTDIGFGYLIPKGTPFEQNPERALGVVFDHSYAIPNTDAQRASGEEWLSQDQLPTGGTKLTVMLGGHWWDGWSEFPSEEEGLEMAKSVLARHLGITAEPVLSRVNMQRDCIPQYTVGHTDRLIKIRRALDHYKGRIRVAGNWMFGVGVNDCIRTAWDAACAIKDGRHGTGLEDVGSTNWQHVMVVAKKDADKSQA